MSFSPMLFAFMFDKTFRYAVIFIFLVFLVVLWISDCSIKQNNDMACKAVEKEVIYEAKVPSHASKTFTYSEIMYNKKKHIYLIRGSVKIKYPHLKIEPEIKKFTAFVKAHNNQENGFKIERLEFEKNSDL